MRNFSESQAVINAIISHCAETGTSEDGLNEALISLLHTSMKAGKKHEHTLCNNDGELLLLVQRFT